ncbi:RBP protein [Aspergillus carlsbadensis]|nr:RBP protein [Aspergillus carlsbadensis]
MASAVATELPRHDLPFEKPRPSEVIISPSGEKGYAWELTPSERSHIAEMLNVDVSEITITRNLMSAEREECRSCGKHMGLDDLVHNAKYSGVHGIAFMLDVLRNGNKNESPGHVVFCSRCTTRFDNVTYWIPAIPWI